MENNSNSSYHPRHHSACWHPATATHALLATIFRAFIEIIHVMHAHRRSKRTNNYSQVAWRKRINHTSSTAIPFCSWRTDNECAINCTHISIHPHHTPPALRALIYSDYSRSGGLDCLDLPPLLIMPSDAETRESVRSWRWEQEGEDEFVLLFSLTLDGDWCEWLCGADAVYMNAW